MVDPEHVSMTRTAYDRTAEVYAELVGTELDPAVDAALDRAVLEAFAELVSSAPGPVADLGCGPGRVAAFLAGRGLDVVGIDVSQAMLGVARSAHPEIRFEEGLLTDLPIASGTLAAAVSWYSIINTPPTHLADVFAELRRVLVPGGHLLVGFQVGDGESIHHAEVYRTAVPLTSYRHDPDVVTEHLTDVGFEIRVRVVREPEFAHESTPQASLIARSGRVER